MKHIKTVQNIPLLIGLKVAPLELYLFALHADGVIKIADVDSGYSKIVLT
jgi:hypothetical protein